MADERLYRIETHYRSGDQATVQEEGTKVFYRPDKTPTIKVDGAAGEVKVADQFGLVNIWLAGQEGKILLGDLSAKNMVPIPVEIRIEMDAQEGTIRARSFVLEQRVGNLTREQARLEDSKLEMWNSRNHPTVVLNGDSGSAQHGLLSLRDEEGNERALLTGFAAACILGGFGVGGTLVLKGHDDKKTVEIGADEAEFGGNGTNYVAEFLNHRSRRTMRLDSSTGSLQVYGQNGPSASLIGQTADMVLGCCGCGGTVHINDVDGKETIALQGNSGDIILQNADCAEEFAAQEDCAAEPGTVMTLDENGLLEQCRTAYDKRAAGVVAGAGGYKPGIVLDRQPTKKNRLPLAMLGKTFCKVDATYSPVEIGDHLTTSPTPGHAMKVSDPLKAFGAIIGKALQPLAEGKGLVPIIVTMQ